MVKLCVRISSDLWLVVLSSLVAVLLRACTTLHPYSGQNLAPMYGDYEAQRHWMEITTNLPVQDWYRNTTDNNLLYWGLDYPPLTAYHMFLCGKIANFLNVNWTRLHDSRGYEGEDHKVFMRTTVLIADLFIYIPSLILFYWTTNEITFSNSVTFNNGGSAMKKGKSVKDYHGNRPLSPALTTILSLLYPGIILIDHGHFQYNCVSLGLLILATAFLLNKHNLLASICFCLALNYKQMELYHALPFFLYLLSTCVPKPGQSSLGGIFNLAKIGITVILTFIVIWSPFLFDFDVFMATLQRQFPVDRGVYEDKVANFWCSFNIFYKLKLKYTNTEMVRLCLFATISAIFPSSIDLFLYPSLKKFVLSLINSSLAFFLFSYHVHEKSILLVAIPVLLYFPQKPFVCFWFLCISVFSMIPLLSRDGLIIATIALMIFYIVSFRVSIEHFYRNSLNTSDGLGEYYRNLLHILLDIEYKKAKHSDILKLTYRQIIKNQDAIKNMIFHLVMILSLIGCVILSILLLVCKAPTRYPDLFPLLISFYCAVHFLGFFIYFNVKQIKIPQMFDDIKNVKIKTQ